MANVTSNFTSLASIDAVNTSLDQGVSLIDSISSATDSYDNAVDLDLVSGSESSTYVTGTLSNGDIIEVFGSNLLGFPFAVTQINYSFTSLGLQVALYGSVSIADDFSEPTGYIDHFVVTSGEAQVTLDGYIDVTGSVATFTSFTVEYGSAFMTVNGSFQVDTAPATPEVSGTVTSVTIGDGTHQATISDIDVSFANFDSYENADQFLAGAQAGNDSVTGTSGSELLMGYGGADTLNGGDGNDSLDGGTGFDIASYAGAGGAISANLGGSASASGADGDDVLSGIEGLIGSAFADTLTGNTSANRIEGRAGNDTINGGAGADTMLGGDGSDQYTVDNASDVVTETNADSVTGGIDTVLTSLASYTLGTRVENLRLTHAGVADGFGNSLDNILWAGAGDNSLDGSTGNDTASYAFAGAAVTASLTSKSATGGSGTDILNAFENIIGSNYNDALTGNTQANKLEGAGGGDTLNGGSGADTMTGGSGSDLFQVDNGGDVVIETGSDPLSGNDTVWSSVSYSLAGSANVENLRITAAGAANATGNELANTLYSGAGDNILDGSGGTDTVSYAYIAGGVNVSLAIQGVGQNTGSAGTDTLIAIENLTGSNYNDTLMGNADDNLIEGGVGTDTMSYANAGAGINASLTSRTATGGEGNDILRRIESLIGSAHNDTLTGSSAGDQLNGGGGADILTGRIGKDSLTGGLGADIFDYNTLAESANSVTKRDQITDFSSAQGDKIDLSDIDANSAVADNQAFTAITSSNMEYSNSTSFTAAGQLYFDQTNHILYGNTDADAQAEFAIELVGVASLSIGNFLA
jgi:Ca2+-binding RTX toxin-like protein